MPEELTAFQQTFQSLSKKIMSLNNQIEKSKTDYSRTALRNEIKILEGKREFLQIGYDQHKDEVEDQKLLFEEDRPKPIHINVIAKEEGTITSFWFKDATVSQLSMINHEIDLLKREILDRINDSPKEWEIKEGPD